MLDQVRILLTETYFFQHSFVVSDDEIEIDEEKSELEIAEEILKRKRKLTKRNKNKSDEDSDADNRIRKRRKIIAYINLSSDDD